MQEIFLVPRLDDDVSDDARDKRWDRDKVDVRRMGIEFTYRPPAYYGGEGYTIEVSAPPSPEDLMALPNDRRPGSRRRSLTPAQRYFQILYMVETGQLPTVASLAEYLHVSEDTILLDVEALNMCCCGRLPHEYLESRIEDGVVTISGPRLYT